MMQPLPLFLSQYTAISGPLLPLIISCEGTELPILARTAEITDQRQIRLAEFSEKIIDLQARVRLTDLYIRRTQLLLFVQWAGVMHFDVPGLRVSIKKLSRSLNLINKKNRATWCPGGTGFPAKFSMGAVILMKDMVLDRIYGSAGDSTEEVIRRGRLNESGGFDLSHS